MADRRAQTSQSHNNEIFYCAEKQRLLEEFTEAIHELISLQEYQVQALINNEPDFARFDLLIHMALQKKREVKYRYLAHVETHGC